MLAVDFDAADADPVNKQQVMSYHDAVRAAVWQECAFNCSDRDLHKFPQRYVRSGAVPSGQDQKTFDVGQLFVCTQGETDDSAIGELYVEYDVELITPQLDFAARILATSAKVESGGTVSKTATFGDAATISGGLAVEASGDVLTFNRVGQYLVELIATGTGAAQMTYASSTATVDSIHYTINGTSTTNTDLVRVDVSERGQTLEVDASGFTTVTSSVARCAPYAYSLN
jgi:hypothetical protein